MTEAVLPYPEDHSQDLVTIQCHLCLHDISYSPLESTVVEKAFITCPNCDYHQPTTRRPRGRDMATFGVSIAAVYFTTIIAILVAR